MKWVENRVRCVAIQIRTTAAEWTQSIAGEIAAHRNANAGMKGHRSPSFHQHGVLQKSA